MRLIVTGMNGTVAPALARALEQHGHQIISWDRSVNPPTDADTVRRFIEHSRPDWIAHVATGAPEWAQWIAQICAASNIGLLWTGSVSVFGDRHQPPLTVDLEPDATDDYGRYKIDCEKRVMSANPHAVVARLGWQIGDAPGSNTMVEYFTRLARENGGRVEASSRWIPSCAMLRDTAKTLAGMLSPGFAGIRHLEGNTAGWSVFQIATALNRRLNAGWNVIEVDQPARDNRMRDGRILIGQVEDALK